MTAYAEALAANRRLCILKLLVEARGSSNESVLQLGLEQLGHRAGLDRPYVREQLRFLETAGCIRIEFFQDKVMVAYLTERGASVASGVIPCDGVAAPGFGD
jgi:hypothetical protein